MVRLAIAFAGSLAGASALAALVALTVSGTLPIEAGPFRLDALSLFLAVAVTVISAVVHVFARRYMDGEAGRDRFFARLSGLTAVVLVLLAADHMALFAAAWVAMGWLLADLIATNRAWPQARAAGRLARTHFLVGGAALAVGLWALAQATGTASLSTAVVAVGAGAASGQTGALAVACAAFALAAAIQCGLVPFHRWLMSSMTAPTPVSAFMHAGLVNAGGILIARTMPVFEAVPHALAVLVVLGATSALAGAVVATAQADVKRGLAASTVAQMGFMVLQCGLGLPAAAMAHLVLHGAYKASLFLGAGSAVAARRLPGGVETAVGRDAVAAAVLAAVAGGAVFALVTGKLAGGLDAGAVLVAFAAIAVAHAALVAAGRETESGVARILGIPLALAAIAAVYGAVVALSETALAAVPGMTGAAPLGPVHVLVVAVFALAWAATAAGLHRRAGGLADRVYVLALRAGQPAPATVTAVRRQYSA
ncbi:MAG: proton-conducting transporter membrane subunit [Azospirillaceae bacterium]